MLLEKYAGDLRKLRQTAEHNPARELLKECKGIGDVGVDILFREAQTIWTELYPFADKRAQRAARKLRLPAEPDSLARLVPGNNSPDYRGAGAGGPSESARQRQRLSPFET